MSDLRSRFARVGVIAAVVLIGAVAATFVVALILRALAHAMWMFVMAPGGLVIVVLTSKWMSVQEARARRRKKS